MPHLSPFPFFRLRSPGKFYACLPLVICILLCSESLFGQTLQLYQTTRSSGVIRELDMVTGNVLATNVGGISNGRGMDFSPLGGLYVAHNNSVSSIATAASAAVSVVTYVGEVPHDLAFDVAGNLYVVTNLNVYVYNTTLTQTLTFAHGITGTTGDGNPNKGWGIRIRPDNGEIYVIGRELRRFNPTTGVQIGSAITTSPFGFAGIAFTTSNFNNAFLYMGRVISGVDQIRVYDTNLNFLRSFYPSHNGNPIDLDVNPVTDELFLFNTVTSNPVNRITSSETVASFSTGANASRGSALGDFNGTILPHHELALNLTELDKNLELQWNRLPETVAHHYEIQRKDPGQNEITAFQVYPDPGSDLLTFQDRYAGAQQLTYVVRAIGANGEQIAMDAAEWMPSPHSEIAVHNLLNEETLQITGVHAQLDHLKISLMDLRGHTLLTQRFSGKQAVIPYGKFAPSIYLLKIQLYSSKGELLLVEPRKVRVANP